MSLSVGKILSMVAMALLLGIAAGCTSASTERQLQAAEADMDSHPDSALTLLQAIDRTRLHGVKSVQILIIRNLDVMSKNVKKERPKN